MNKKYDIFICDSCDKNDPCLISGKHVFDNKAISKTSCDNYDNQSFIELSDEQFNKMYEEFM